MDLHRRKYRVALRILVGMVLYIAAVSAARADEFKLFVVKEILAPPAMGARCARPELIAQKNTLIKNLSDTSYATEFVKAMSDNFKIEDKITSADRSKTFIVALQINRISKYVIDKSNGNSDVYLPITETLFFSDVTTGKILYSYSVTNYALKTVANSQVNSAALNKELISTSFTDALKRLITKASANFNPTHHSYKIIDKQLGFYFIASGLKDGLKLGDGLEDGDNSLSIVYAGDDYAVASKVAGEVDLSHAWASVSNDGLSGLNRPVAYVSANIKGEGDCDTSVEPFDPASARQQFTDAMGDTGPFSVVAISPEYGKLIKHVIYENSGFNDKYIAKNTALPEYYAFLDIERPVVIRLATNLSHKQKLKVAQSASLRVTNIEGRVIYADTATESITDEVVAGIGFDPSSRAEVALRNVFTTLSDRARKNLKFQKLRLQVTAAKPDSVSINDPLGQLNIDDSVNLLHLISSSKMAAKTQIVAPISKGSVQDLVGNAAQAVLLPAEEPVPEVRTAVRSGDVAELDMAATVGGAVKRPVSICGGQAGLGAIGIDGLDEMALAALTAAGIKGIHKREETKQVVAALNLARPYKFRDAEQAEPGICIMPVYKIDPIASNCDSAQVCTQTLSTKAGFRLLKGDTIVAKMAFDGKVSTEGYMSSTPPDVVAKLVSLNAQSNIFELLSGLAKDKEFQSTLNKTQ